MATLPLQQPTAPSNSARVRIRIDPDSLQNLIFSAFVLALLLALLRSGPTNLVLVLATSALLLCNPWVRTLLELPPINSRNASSRTSVFDPATYLLFIQHHDANDSTCHHHQSASLPTPNRHLDDRFDPSDSAKQLLSLQLVSQPLQGSLQRLIRLVLRDFVKHWYDPITFSHPGFLSAADKSISHFVTSVCMRLHRIRNIDASSELLLTTQSVVLASLRRKRIQAQSSTPIDENLSGHLTWPTTSARIDSLRKAVSKLLISNLCISERSSPVVVSLITEILSKQCWEVVQYISNPDFINAQIVRWGQPASETRLEGQLISPQELQLIPNPVSPGEATQENGTDSEQRPPTSSDDRASNRSNMVSSDIGRLNDHDIFFQPQNESLASVVPPQPTQQSRSDGAATPPFPTKVDAAGETVDQHSATFLVQDTRPELIGSSIASSDSRPVLSPPPIMPSNLPSTIPEPVLPESIRASLRSAQAQATVTENTSSEGYSIPYEIQAISQTENLLLPDELAPSSISLPPSKALQSTAETFRTSLEDVLSRKDTTTYDAFEHFLEDPANPYCSPGEGETLLRLHTQLGTLLSIAEFASLDEETLRADSTSILQQSLRRMPKVPSALGDTSSLNVCHSIQSALDRLEMRADINMLQPLVQDVLKRLDQLYAAFQDPVMLKDQNGSVKLSLDTAGLEGTTEEPTEMERGTDANTAHQCIPSPSPVSQSRQTFAYEPRHKNTEQPVSKIPSSMPPPALPSSSSSVAPQTTQLVSSPSADKHTSGQPTPSLSRNISRENLTNSTRPSQAPDIRLPRAQGPEGKLCVQVSDVGPSADKAGAVNPRTLELMIAVEGLAESGDGFVLLRQWSDLETLDAELKRMPRSLSPSPRLPLPKGKSSSDLCLEVEHYLRLLLSPAEAISIPALQRFMDKTRAGASSLTVRENGPAAAFFGGIGKNIVSGVGAVGKSARTGFGMQQSQQQQPQSQPAKTIDSLKDRPVEYSRSADVNDRDALGRADNLFAPAKVHAIATSHLGEASPTLSAATTSSRPGTPPVSEAELSAHDMDQILSAVFAVADEAFNLQGGWTLRRGMLRVLEQVVRTTYSGSLRSTLNSAGSSLSDDNFASWIDEMRESFWPNDEWSTEPSKLDGNATKNHERARAILLSYAPAQAAYLLGPGGRLACTNALATIHDTLVDPLTAADLSLTMMLKALEMASR